MLLYSLFSFAQEKKRKKTYSLLFALSCVLIPLHTNLLYSSFLFFSFYYYFDCEGKWKQIKSKIGPLIIARIGSVPYSVCFVARAMNSLAGRSTCAREFLFFFLWGWLPLLKREEGGRPPSGEDRGIFVVRGRLKGWRRYIISRRKVIITVKGLQ